MDEQAPTSAHKALGGPETGLFKKMEDLLPDVVADVKRRYDLMNLGHRKTIGLPTGIDTLDELLGGLQPGIHILSAKPTVGKTTLVLQIAANAASAQYPVLFVTFEEDPARLVMKAVCQQANLAYREDNQRPYLVMKKFEHGKGDPHLFEEAANLYAPRLQSLSFIGGTGKLTVDLVKARAQELLREYGADQVLVVVDYIQRWAIGMKESGEMRHQVNALVGDLRDMAMELKWPVLAISSQNRIGQGTDDLTSLKESGDLEYTADTITFLKFITQPTSNSREMTLSVKKNRFGETAEEKLTFFTEWGIFRDLEGKG
jgi:replicative DNA helicase